jgi:hypothetical protein
MKLLTAAITPRVLLVFALAFGCRSPRPPSDPSHVPADIDMVPTFTGRAYFGGAGGVVLDLVIDLSPSAGVSAVAPTWITVWGASGNPPDEIVIDETVSPTDLHKHDSGSYAVAEPDYYLKAKVKFPGGGYEYRYDKIAVKRYESVPFKLETLVSGGVPYALRSPPEDAVALASGASAHVDEGRPEVRMARVDPAARHGFADRSPAE